MRMLRRSVEIGLLATALAALVPAAHAQQRIPPAAQRALIAAPQADPASAVAQGRIANLPPGWVEQLQGMGPAEQERFLRNNARFRNLPPQQQALIRRRLRVWNSLSDEQREAVLERQQIWEQLPPAQRRQVRESLLPRWQSLRLSSRQLILSKLRELRGLDEAERSARLSDESFLGDMSLEEREMLSDLSGLVAS